MQFLESFIAWEEGRISGKAAALFSHDVDYETVWVHTYHAAAVACLRLSQLVRKSK